jgi:RNA polymerase sigma factor (sigma-70 family)
MIIPTHTLLQQIVLGNASAVKDCQSRYGGMVWSLAWRFLGNAADADDATQDILIELWKNADRYNPSLSAESTYVTMVTRRRLIDRRRKITRQPRLAMLPDALCDRDKPPHHDIDTGEEASRARQAFALLNPGQQQVLWLRHYASLTQEQIAHQTGMPLGTVKTYARRGLIKLRALLRHD